MAKIKSGFVLAGFPGYRYQDFDVQLQPGDTIFTYTDGIPEAINDKNEEFGLDRLQKVLNDSKDSPVRLMCRKVLPFCKPKPPLQLGMVLANLGQIMYIESKRGSNMSETAFAELESQVEELPLFQIVVLRQKLDRILERKKSATNVAAGLALLDEFAGSVDREIDYKKEREESRDFR